MRRALLLCAACGSSAPPKDAAVVTPVARVTCALAWRPTADAWVAPTAPPPPPVAHHDGAPRPRAIVETAQVTGSLGADTIKKRVKEKDLVACYQDAMRRKPLAGVVDVTFAIDPTGRVVSASGEGLDGALAGCLAGTIRAIAFPKSAHGATVRLPITLRIDGGATSDDADVDAGVPLPVGPWSDLVWADDDPDPALTIWAAPGGLESCGDARVRFAVSTAGAITAIDTSSECARDRLSRVTIAPPPPLAAAVSCTIGAPTWTVTPGPLVVTVAADQPVTIPAIPYVLAAPDGALISDMVPLGVGPAPSPRPHTRIELDGDPSAAVSCTDCDHVLELAIGATSTGAELAKAAAAARAAGVERIVVVAP